MDIVELIRWRPGIGDPSFMGWVTVAAYAAAAVFAWRAAMRTRRLFDLPRGSREIWMFVALLMLMLCVNKQLDLQSLVTDVGRVVAKRDGWYANRHDAQLRFIEVIVGGAALAAIVLGVWFRRFWAANPLLGIGLAFLLSFVGIRAISFHHVDMLIGTTVAGVRMNWLFELTGIGLVAAAGPAGVPRRAAADPVARRGRSGGSLPDGRETSTLGLEQAAGRATPAAPGVRRTGTTTNP